MSMTRVLVVPGGTSVGGVALAHAAIHKLIEIHEARQRDPDTAPARMVVAIRDPRSVPPSSLRGAATSPTEAFPADVFPEFAAHVDNPDFFDGIDLILATSGSSAGKPRLVGLSTQALIASAEATAHALGGHGRWILALPAHHIGGAMVLARNVIAGRSPLIVDTSNGFTPADLLPALRAARDTTEYPTYLSLVPLQLRSCLDADEDVLDGLRHLKAILVGGSASDPDLLARARDAGLTIVESYGMTETSGGCVYDGHPLAGVTVRAMDIDGQPRLAISGRTLLTRYLDGDTPTIDEGGIRWLLTGDLGRISASGQVEVFGRADDVIVSGGLNIAPAPVRIALNSHPDVSDSWVLGTEDTKWGQVVTAVVVPSAGSAHPPLAEFGPRLRDHVGSVLGRPQAPRRLIVVDSLPHLPSGKVDRLSVRAIAEIPSEGTEWRR
ncbi:MAG: AMP-binding protein [Actinomycetaceae bacterium]|nr:AMP-binding protein [Actinomycetaceae bacterium]